MWAPKVPPRPYQKGAVAWLAKRGYGALLLDTRTGKTKIAVDWLSWLAQNRGVDTVVVICPRLAMDVWIDELEKNWWGPDYQLYDLRRRVDRQSPNRKRLWPTKAMWANKAMRIVLVNYERFSIECQDVMRGIHSLDKGKSAVVLDESHAIKRPASKRSRRITGLGASFEYRACLTATPVSKRGRIDEVYPQWVFIDPSIRERWPTAKSFREYFGEWDDSAGFPRFVRPLHTAEYTELIAENSIALTREAALGVEPVKYQEHLVGLPVDLHALYLAMAKDKPQELAEAGLTPPEHVFSKFSMSQRMADGCVPLAGGGYRVWRHKLDKAVELALESPKSIICCNFLAELELVRRALEAQGRPVVKVSGETKRKNGELDRFAGMDVATLVVQPSVVAVAVDLSCADRVVWYSVPTSWILFKQMSDRIALNPKAPTAHIVLALGTSDGPLYDSLVDARGYRSELLADPEAFLLGRCQTVASL